MEKPDTELTWNNEDFRGGVLDGPFTYEMFKKKYGTPAALAFALMLTGLAVTVSVALPS